MANVGNMVHSLSYLYFHRLSTVINTSIILSQAWANLCRVSAVQHYVVKCHFSVRRSKDTTCMSEGV